VILTMDIGGSNIRYNIIDSSEEIVEHHSMSSRDISIIDVIESIIKAYDISKIGISYAGQIDNGDILSSPNIRVDRPDIEHYFKERYGIPLAIDNDLKCAALAEHDYWRSSGSIVVAYIGTGFGAAIVEDGRVVRGSHNLAGEIGHIPFRNSPIACGCGNHYCIEASCSGEALSKYIDYYDLPIDNDPLDSLKKLNNPNAQKILDNFHEGLLFAVATIISLLNPEKIILGGGVVDKNHYLLDFLKENIDRYALSTSLKQTDILISRLDDAPIRGARLLLDSNQQSKNR